MIRCTQEEARHKSESAYLLWHCHMVCDLVPVAKPALLSSLVPVKEYPNNLKKEIYKNLQCNFEEANIHEIHMNVHVKVILA